MKFFLDTANVEEIIEERIKETRVHVPDWDSFKQKHVDQGEEYAAIR